MSLSDFSVQPGSVPSGDALVYEFGARVDSETVALVGQQITLSRRLYNELVAIMRDVVQDLQKFVVAIAGPEVERIQAEIEAMNDAFGAAKARNDEPAMKQVAQERREKWKVLSAMLKPVRKACRSEIQERFLSRIGRNSSCATYQARSKAVAEGLGWGTAGAVLDAALVAFKKSFALGKAPRFASGADIDQDCLTLQFTAAGGIAADALLAGRQGDFVLRATNGCGRRKYGDFKFRLGAAKADTYATGTWQYHRPLPKGSHVAIARLVRRKMGPKYTWAVQLLVKPETPVLEIVGERRPLATVHFGWANDIDGRRVASIADSADPGAARILALPPGVEAGLARASDIQALRDSVRDEIAAKVRSIELPPTVSPELTEIMGKIRKTRPQDISANRLHFVCRLLREEDRLPEWLEAWRKVDKLQWQDQVHIAKRARNARKTFYRETAIALVRNYEAVAIEPLDLEGAAQKVSEITGEKTEFAKKARAGRVVAALYELESAIRWAASKTGAALLELTGPTASQCAICGFTVEVDQEDHQILHCHDCGAVLDRKQNGAATAWQAVNDTREDAVEAFWTASLANARERQETKAGKLAKMAEGRRKRRDGADALRERFADEGGSSQ